MWNAYRTLDTCGELLLSVNGSRHDAQFLGVLHTSIQDMVDKVSLWLLAQEGLLEPTWRRKKYLPLKRVLSGHSLVRACLRSLTSSPNGIFETFDFAILSSLDDETAVQALRHFVSHLIWGVVKTGVAGVVGNATKLLDDVPPLRRQDPFDLGSNVREIVTELCLESPDVTIELRAGRSEPISAVTLAARRP